MTNKEANILIKKTIPKGNSAIDIQLREALEMATSALTTIDQFKWERDVAIQQLNELGLGFGEKVDDVQKAINVYEKIPSVIKELESLKVSIEGQIFYNRTMRLKYENKMEGINETVDEAINIIKQLLE